MKASGQLHAPAALPPGKEPPRTHWIGGWVGPRIHEKHENTLKYGKQTKRIILQGLRNERFERISRKACSIVSRGHRTLVCATKGIKGNPRTKLLAPTDECSDFTEINFSSCFSRALWFVMKCKFWESVTVHSVKVG
jgi:hypothetical protein